MSKVGFRMENNTFKGSLFGGFNREDVIDYIKKTSAESTARIESLEGDIDKLCAQEQELRRSAPCAAKTTASPKSTATPRRSATPCVPRWIQPMMS